MSGRFLRIAMLVLSATAFAQGVRAQAFGSRVEAWGESYEPAGLVNVEARSSAYPWLRAEAQVWAGESPSPEGGSGDVVVLAANVRDPLGYTQLRAGRFVLSAGAVRPVHIDGGIVRAQSRFGTAIELFSGAPVVPRFGEREYDWLVGGRLSQRLFEYGSVGASYVERRDRGRESDEEIGADLMLYPLAQLTLASRASFDLMSRGLSELAINAGYGGADRRVELFASRRDASLILPATSLFSVLSNAPSVQVGADARYRIAPRLWLEGLAAARGYDDEYAPRAELGGTLWLDADGEGVLEGRATRDGIGDEQWTGLRVVVYRDVIEDLRVSTELEAVVPDHARGRGEVWPWGRCSARYTLLDDWQLSAGFEGSSSPEFQRMFQGLLRVAYIRGAS